MSYLSAAHIRNRDYSINVPQLAANAWKSILVWLKNEYGLRLRMLEMGTSRLEVGEEEKKCGLLTSKCFFFPFLFLFLTFLGKSLARKQGLGDE